MVSHNFELERCLPKEETNRTHLSIEEYKKVTNYDKTKEILKDITLELPEVPSIEDFNRVVFKRNEKIQKEIIEPKDKLIEKLYSENKRLHGEIERQVNVIDEAEKYQKERDKILEDNENLHNKVYQMEHNYKVKSNSLDFRYNNRKEEIEKEFEKKAFNLEYEYKHKMHKLEKENTRLHKIIKTFEETVKKFIKWICNKFELPSEDEIVRNFEKETGNSLNAEKQFAKKERVKEFEKEL